MTKASLTGPMVLQLKSLVIYHLTYFICHLKGDASFECGGFSK